MKKTCSYSMNENLVCDLNVYLNLIKNFMDIQCMRKLGSFLHNRPSYLQMLQANSRDQIVIYYTYLIQYTNVKKYYLNIIYVKFIMYEIYNQFLI